MRKPSPDLVGACWKVPPMRITSKVLAFLGAGILAAVIGQASTASNTVAASTAGYGSAAVSGATANSVAYTLSSDGATITATTVVFSGDLTGKTVSAGFNSSALSGCTLGSYNSGAGTTTATCSGLSQSTASASSLAIAVK
jgi:hypothetical protein